MDIAGRVVRLFEKEKADRAQWETVWQDVAELIMPNQSTFTTDYHPGQLRRRRIFDDTAEDALETFAGGVHANLTPRQARWFYLQPEDRELRESKPVKVWLAEVHTEMFRALNDPRANLHHALHKTYMDLGGMGTSCLWMGERRGGLSFHNRWIGEVFVRENAEGIIDTVMRESKWKLSELVEEWGIQALPKRLQDQFMQAKDADMKREHCVIHAVMPREVRVRGMLDRRSRPVAGYYVLRDGDHGGHLLEETGYSEFPYAVPRLSVRTGEKYGVGIGVRTLPRVRMMQRMWEVYIRAAQKAIDPPLQVPDDSFIGPVRTYPGGINYYRGGEEGRIEPLVTGARPDISEQVLEQERQNIRHAFYNDVFDITADSTGVNVKATFTLERRQDKLMRIAPLFSRIEPDLLEPLVMRTYAILRRQGRLPEPPPELEGRTVAIAYQSPIARAQRAGEADDIVRFTQMLAPYAEADPGVLDNVDTDELAQLMGNQIMNVPAIIMRDPTEVAQRREARAQAESQAAGIQAAGGVAGALKDVAAAQRGG